MRPDEHKKKKNAAYKKKHGIDNSGKGRQETKTKVNAPTSSSAATASSSLSSNIQIVKSQDRFHKSYERKGHYHPSDSESKSDEEDVKRKTFRRREIVSNWKKYDLEPDTDEKSATKGEDYKTLLNMTGEAMSQFRFKDEKDWEDEEEELTKESTCHFLSLDPTELAESLACIPTHQLLGVSDELFTAEQITAMVDESRKHEDQMANLTQIKKKKAAENISLSSAEHDVSLEVYHKSLNTGSDRSKLLSSALRSPHSHASAESNKERLSEILDTSSMQKEAQNVVYQDIDNIKCLGAESLSSKPPAHEQCGTSQPLSLQDEDLDSLLEMSVPQDGRDNDLERKEKETLVTNLNAESAELEDWLDSVLDA